MIALCIYAITFLIFVYILFKSFHYSKSSREGKIHEIQEEISHLLNKKILALDSNYDVYEGETKEWQLDFHNKVIDYQSNLRQLSSVKVTPASFPRLYENFCVLLNDVDYLVDSENNVREYRKLTAEFVTDLKISIMDKPNVTVESQIQLLNDLLSKDPIGAYKVTKSIKKAKKNSS